MTIREAQIAARAILAHLPDAARDAELLLLHTLGLTRAQLLANPTRDLTPEQETTYNSLITRRAAHEPIQYITGTQEFYGLAFKVTPATLIPRPETELLVESVLERLPHNQPLHIADIGTGTGCIAIALAVHLPQAQLTALDLSKAALAVARENAATHNVSQRVHTLHSDLLNAVSNQSFDAIVSNPPYIPHSDRPTLAPQVRDHEPATALFADEDGLALYRRLIPQAFTLLKPGGLLALEIGYGQSPAIQQMLTNWTNLETLNDLQGIPRTILATRP